MQDIFTATQTDKYLKKLGFYTKPSVSFETLCKLLSAQQQTIPFENLDCMAQKKLSLTPSALFEKLIINSRGGIGFELGTVFYLLLRSLGFSVRCFATNLFDIEGEIAPPLHILSCVEISDKKYICDAGMFNETARTPLLFQTGTEQSDGLCAYRFKLDCTKFILEQKESLFWAPLYTFEDKEAEPAQIETAIDFCKNDRFSPFNKSNKISIYLPDTFAYISGDMMKYKRKGQTIKQLAIEDRRQMNKLLASVFHINFGEIKFVCGD